MTYEGFGSSERACLSGNYKPSIFSFQQYYGSGKDASSKLMVEWTNQHGCGGNPKVSCNYVIQVTMVTKNDLTLALTISLPLSSLSNNLTPPVHVHE